jgi:hypothetical protein
MMLMSRQTVSELSSPDCVVTKGGNYVSLLYVLKLLKASMGHLSCSIKSKQGFVK